MARWAAKWIPARVWKPDKTAAALMRRREEWLPFLNTYRTMCAAPEPDFRRLLEDIRELQIAA